jgi:hypothetical protein
MNGDARAAESLAILRGGDVKYWVDYHAGNDRHSGTRRWPIKTLAEVARRMREMWCGTVLSVTLRSDFPLEDPVDPVLEIADCIAGLVLYGCNYCVYALHGLARAKGHLHIDQVVFFTRGFDF